MSAPCLLLAGGGTGGHVFPAIALAESIQALADVHVVFCGTERGIESRVVPARGFLLEILDVEPMKGGGPRRAIRGAAVAARATASAFGLLRRLRPRVTVSVGGYAAGPVTLASVVSRVPIAVLEPNSVIGLANRIVAPFAARAYVAWQETAVRFRPSARRVTGVPLRPGFAARPYVPRGTSRILVMGGSQGASSLNELLPAAIARLSGRSQLQIVHQTGRDRDARVREAYAREGLEAVEVVPFLDDVAQAIADADLVVCRSGASTVAELAAVGRAAVLVPFPHAADDHQGKNAEALARVGGAVVVREGDATPGQLAATIERILGDDSARVTMARASQAWGRPDAAAVIAEDLLALARIDRRAGRSDGPGHPTTGFEEAR